jgi:hypothetical protein
MKNNKKSSGILKVEEITLDSLVKLKKPLNDVKIKEGEKAYFECEVEINPILKELNFPILVNWTKNKTQTISADFNKYELTDKLDQKSRSLGLTIKNCLVPNDSSEYTCKLIIGDNKGIQFVLCETSANLTVQETEAKLIKGLPKTLTVPQDSDVVLECEFSKGNLDVQWTKDGKPLNEVSPLSIQEKFTDKEGKFIYRIRLPHSQLSDAGKYKLQYQSIQTECKLIIKKPKLEIIKPFPEIIKVNESDLAVLECEFSRSIINEPDLKIEWFKNEKRLLF